ncbi:MAG: O-antigen ligase family protein [Blastocatellia bacterium]
MISRPDARLDEGKYDLASVKTESGVAAWANSSLLFFLALFAVSVPHSIAAAQASAAIALLAWLIRDLAMRRFHFRRTPIDLPLLLFALLTALSSFFSTELSVSIPKLKTLLLFGVVYVLATNLGRRGVRVVAGLLVVSSLAGVGFSLVEKVCGRGMIVTAIEPGSPLSEGKLQPGDVIWMIARSRVYSPEQAAGVIRRIPPGEAVNVETLHEGDPVEVKLKVTDDLKAQSNPLGVTSQGRSRRFRVSGFSRQFLTYAEQMQILALFVFGGLLTGVRLWRRQSARSRLGIFSLLFVLFALALVLTASRAVIASFIVAVLFVSINVGGRLAPAIALVSVLALGGLGFYAVTAARQKAAINFGDDSTARRIAYMQAGLRVIPQHPLLGVGMDSHKRHWREWGFPGEYVTHTHSTPIQIAMDRGLPALASYLWLIAAMMWMLRRAYKEARGSGDDFSESLHLGAFGALIGFSVSSLANYNFGDSEALMMLLCVVGLSIVQAKSA